MAEAKATEKKEGEGGQVVNERKILVRFENRDSLEIGVVTPISSPNDTREYTFSLREGKLFVDNKEVKVRTWQDFTPEEKEEYTQLAEADEDEEEELEEDEDDSDEGKEPEFKDEKKKKTAQLFASLYFFYDEDNFPDIAGDGTRMGVCDEFLRRLLFGEALAPKYVVKFGRLRIDGREEEEYIPTTGSDLMGFDFEGVVRGLNKMAGLETD